MSYFKFSKSVAGYLSPDDIIKNALGAKGRASEGDIIYGTIATINKEETLSSYVYSYVKNDPNKAGVTISDSYYYPIQVKTTSKKTGDSSITLYATAIETEQQVKDDNLNAVVFTFYEDAAKYTGSSTSSLSKTGTFSTGQSVVLAPFEDGSYQKTTTGTGRSTLTWIRTLVDGSYQYAVLRSTAPNGQTNNLNYTIKSVGNNTVISNQEEQKAANATDPSAPTSTPTTETGTEEINDTGSVDTMAGTTMGYEAIVEEEGLLSESSTYNPDITELLGQGTGDNYYEDNSILKVRDVLGVFGLPYQFMPHVDPRITGAVDSGGIEDLGIDYAEKIIGSIPLLFITPGKPSFMQGYSDDDQKTAIGQIISNFIGGGSSVSIDDLISKNGKFYTFEPDITGYYNYVNPMCRICAQLLGIDGEEYSIGDTNNDSIDWKEFTQERITGITSILTEYRAIPFYLDSETQISESMSSDVTDSSLASTVDSFSDMGRELMFYLGYTPALAGLDSLTDADVLDNAENFSNFVSSISGNNIFQSLAAQVTAVATGGRLEFPKIWSNSSFSRSYDVTIKLRSPDMDNLSLWTNIIVPLCHILGFVQPRMVANNPNAYTSPYLVRATYKGFFNVDMGIISGCNISKGDDAQWSINGIPTTVDVNLTITDLYDVMSITPGKSIGNMFGFDVLDNTAQMDYLMNMCGINVYKPEINRIIDLYLTQNLLNPINDSVSNIFGHLRDKITTTFTNVYRGML